MAGTYTQVTLTQFTSLVRDRLGPSAFWTDDEIRQNINAALRTWNALTGYWAGTATFTVTVNYPYYALAASLVFGARLDLDGAPLQQSSVFGWDQQDPYWMLRRGLPTEWSPVGVGIIALRPVPPNSGNLVTVTGVSVTPILVNPGDFINIGEEEFTTLVNYILHILSFKEGGAEFSTTLPQQKAFLAAAGLRNEKLRASSLYRRVLGIDQAMQTKPWRRAAGDGIVVGVRG